MRERLDRGGVAVDYQVERSNERWADHRLRTLVTGAAIAWLKPSSLVDPACGDGSIVFAADRISPIQRVYLRDISHPNIERVIESSGKGRGWSFQVASIEDALNWTEKVDVAVLTEVLEHLQDPDAILRLARASSRYLVASSPEMRPGQRDSNPEHLWQFDADGYREMLEGTGWIVEQHTTLRFRSEYDFGVWVCQ